MVTRITILPILLIPAVAEVVSAAESAPSSISYALESMAPAGRWAARVELRSAGYDQRYRNDGEREDLDAAFDNVNLNSAVFPALAALGASATLGTTALDTDVDVERVELTFGYGISANLTVGLIVPMARTHTAVDFSVMGGNVGFNPAFNPALPIGPSNFPFAPVGGGAAAPVGTEGVKQLLTDPVFGYGYDPIEDTSSYGFDDPTAGVLWRFHKGASDSAVLGLGVRVGVADGDDPDNLLDVPVGDGSTDLRTRLEYFRDLGAGFDLRLLGESKIQTPDHVDKRVPAPGQLLAAASSKERVERDLGNIWECDVEMGRRWGDWRLAGTWHRYIKGHDQYSSDRGTDTSTLEANTSVYASQWRASLSWSGINAWRSKALPLPLVVKLEMQETYAGRNFPDVRDVYLQATTFF